MCLQDCYRAAFGHGYGHGWPVGHDDCHWGEERRYDDVVCWYGDYDGPFDEDVDEHGDCDCCGHDVPGYYRPLSKK